MRSEELHRLYKQSELVTYMRVNRLKWVGNIVRIFEKKIRKWLLHGSPGGRRMRIGKGYRQIAQHEEYELGKDVAKFINKKNCRVTAKNMSDRRKQKRVHGQEIGREAVRRRRRNLMNHHKLTYY